MSFPSGKAPQHESQRISEVMELCAKQSCYADATHSLPRPVQPPKGQSAPPHSRTVPARHQSENKPPRDENNATGSSVFCHSERSRGTCFPRSSNLALKALQPMFRIVARPSRNRLDVTATPPLRIARDCYVVPRRRTVDRFLIQLAAGESGYETPSDRDEWEQ